MKRAFLVAILVVVSSAVVWASEPTPPSQVPFSLSCALGTKAAAATSTPAFTHRGLPENVGAGIPQPVFDTGCSAEQQCPLPGGGTTTVSCTGAGSCSVGTYWVTCDGTTHYCGCVSCDLCYCDCYSGGGTAHECLQECKFDC